MARCLLSKGSKKQCGELLRVVRRKDQNEEHMSGKVRFTPEERFWSKVNKWGQGACWPWIGATNKQGYGYFKALGFARAHRFSWFLSNGAIPAGKLVLHRCDNPACVNPSHLFLGSHLDNSADKLAKGRGRWNPAKGEACGASKLSSVQVAEIRSVNGTNASIGLRFNISRRAVSDIKNGKTWAHLPEVKQ